MSTDAGKPDLAAFIGARLDEEQARAEAMEHDANLEDEFHSCPAARTEPLGDLEWGEDHCWCGLAGRKAKRLREVEALRAILVTHGPDPIGKFGSVEEPRCLVCLAGRDGYEEQWEADKWPCLTLRSIAAIWSDHPDYPPSLPL